MCQGRAEYNKFTWCVWPQLGPATQWSSDLAFSGVFVCVSGFLPTLTCTVLCETHENIILLPLELYSFNL